MRTTFLRRLSCKEKLMKRQTLRRPRRVCFFARSVDGSEPPSRRLHSPLWLSIRGTFHELFHEWDQSRNWRLSFGSSYCSRQKKIFHSLLPFRLSVPVGDKATENITNDFFRKEKLFEGALREARRWWGWKYIGDNCILLARLLHTMEGVLLIPST